MTGRAHQLYQPHYPTNINTPSTGGLKVAGPHYPGSAPGRPL